MKIFAEIFAVAAAVVGLTGCATYSEMQARPAEYVANTTKSPEAFATCVLPKMVETNAAAHVIADGTARTVIVPIGGGTPKAVMVTVMAVPRGHATHVEMRHMRSLSDFQSQWQQVQSCL